MKELLEKLGTYNLFNFFFPGIIFSALLERLTTIKITQANILVDVFLYYFVGMIISRVGSVVVENNLVRLKFITKSDYKEYVAAEKKDNKLLLMLEVCNTYRTITAMMLLMIIVYSIAIIGQPLITRAHIIIYCLFILLLLLFSFAYQKQTEYINKRVEANK